MSARKIVIFGAGDIAQLAWFYFTHDTGRRVAGFTVDRDYLQGSEFQGLPLVPFDEVEARFPPDEHDMFVALSYAKRNSIRQARCAEAGAKGYDLASYISSRLTIFPGVSVGKNCFLLENNTIQPYVTIGDNVTLWSGNHIGHHSTIDDHCFITSHVVVSGGVHVGRNCFIGVNATIRDHVEIGERCLIGAGALILESTPPGTVYVARGTRAAEMPGSTAGRS
jgi:sugar O-acyltransferase (sialic acid O-acetyltransferase NeuD family)